MLENLLKKDLSRLEILKNKTYDESFKTVKITVYRNHSFEHMEGMINSFLAVSGIKAEFIYSDYDDSLNFSVNSEVTSDLNIIWIDFSRYKNIDVQQWINDRILNLKSISKKPILVYYVGNYDINIQNAISANTEMIELDLKELFYDYEKFEYSGTNLSSKASIKVAQELGLKYIPSFFKTPIKAVVVDMDNTFYQGIVGEDGIANIKPNIEFQNQLKKLKDKGVLLSIASKNEMDDVKKMFIERKDFVLKWEDFSSHNISWETKDKAILNTAKQFNIGLDSILFVDDNIGEINYVKMTLPQVNTLIADENLIYKMNLYPLLERYSISVEDNLRANDIDANQKRNEMVRTMNKDDYFKALGMQLSYSIDNKDNFERAIQLLNKTNQFIFSYKRYSMDEIKDNQHILTISLKDNLSDSGIIGIIVAQNVKNELYVDEVVVSCRALGRNIEDLMLNSAFKYLINSLKTSSTINFDFKIGPRNNPAKTWLESYSNIVIENDMQVKTTVQNIKENENIKMEFLCELIS